MNHNLIHFQFYQGMLIVIYFKWFCKYLLFSNFFIESQNISLSRPGKSVYSLNNSHLSHSLIKLCCISINTSLSKKCRNGRIDCRIEYFQVVNRTMANHKQKLTKIFKVPPIFVKT